MAKELLKEAIADAKAVREVAMQNAKLALEEAFNSKIQSMLAAKLNEELDEEVELEEVYNEDEDNMEEGSYMEDGEEMEENYDTGGDPWAINPDFRPGGVHADPNFQRKRNKGEDEEDDFEKPIDYTMGKGSGKGSNQLPNPPDEINLEEILASLEEEMNYSEDGDETMEEDLDEEIDFTLEEDEELEEEINLDTLMEELMDEELTNESLDQYLTGAEGIITAIAAAAAVGVPALVSTYKKELGDALKSGGSEVKKVVNKIAAKAKSMKKADTNEAYSTIETLRTQLAEVNLLNAKLLYVNKLFKANNLTETQKLKVVEALDEATNVKEAKLVFNTLKESFETTGLKKNITEGFGYASKATGAPAKKKVLTEQADETVARFQKLANIKF